MKSTHNFFLFVRGQKPRTAGERQLKARGTKGDGGGELSPSHHMRSSTNRTSYRKSEAGEQQRRSISGSSGATGTGTGTEETHLLAANNHHRKSSYQSTTVRRRSPRTTPSARNSAMDGQHLQQQYGGGQGAAAVPGEDHANQYLAYSEQQQQQQPAAQHHAQHMQYAEQDQYSHDEYIHQPPMDHQYHHQQQYQYDQRQQQQQRPPQQHEVPPQQHYAAEGVGGPAHAQPPQPPLMDQEAANAEIMAVRGSALTVFSPLTYTWVSLTVRNKRRRQREGIPWWLEGQLFTALVQSCVACRLFIDLRVRIYFLTKRTKKLERSGSKGPYFGIIYLT